MDVKIKSKPRFKPSSNVVIRAALTPEREYAAISFYTAMKDISNDDKLKMCKTIKENNLGDFGDALIEMVNASML